MMSIIYSSQDHRLEAYKRVLMLEAPQHLEETKGGGTHDVLELSQSLDDATL